MLDLVQADYPDYPTTQQLDLPADVNDSARIVLNRPVYLDMAGRLWITHDWGKSVDEVLAKPLRARTLIVKDEVRFVHYDEDGIATVVTHSADDPDTTLRFCRPRTAPQMISIAPDSWSSAIAFGQSILIPTSNGFAEVDVPGKTPLSIHPDTTLNFESDDHTQPIVLTTLSTILCWAPWDNNAKGSIGAIVRIGDKTYPLNASNGWFDRIIQLVPLADGSILAVGKTDNGIELKLNSLEPSDNKPAVDHERLTALVRKLADPEPVVREKTQRELEAMGPAIFSELEALRERMPPEAQVRIEALLGQRFVPTLAGLHPMDGPVQTASRFSDGGCVLLLSGGGTYDEDGEDKSLIPAWISIRPGQFIERMAPGLTSGFAIGKYQFQAFGNETLVLDPILGVRRWIGAKLVDLLSKDYRQFDRFVGIDANRRWIFKSTTEPTKTLILDPSLPDLTPKLPIWMIEAPDGAGWIESGWPAMTRGKQVFVLDEHGWRTLDDKKEKLLLKPPNVLPTVATDSAGNRLELSNGRLTGTFRGKPVSLTVPDEASTATMVFLQDEQVFLVAPGSVFKCRISRETQQLKMNGIFAKGLPSTPLRVWQDPAGRVIFADGSTLWVTFPTGRVPPDLANMILNQKRN